MTISGKARRLSVLCVDDNPAVADALAFKLRQSRQFEWRGSLGQADDLVETVVRDTPELVILDVDIPGKDPFVALQELTERCPDTRTVVFSGHVRGELVKRAVDAGAWGYVSKNDGEHALMEVLRRVADGELALSPEAEQVYRQ